jgi:D-psicose/D-tagatose/L-ribulose 3-epimerase
MSLGAAALSSRLWARIGNIQIGVCRPSRDLEDAVRYGFDYLEPAAAEIAEMDEGAFQKFKTGVLASPIRCQCFNSFIRKLRVVGDDVHEVELHTYIESTLERCRQLGGGIVVWGSAGSRNVEDGFSRDRAWKQIQSFLRAAGDIGRSKGTIIAIEPLRRQESNIFNTGAETLRMVREVHHPNVKMIIDYYHLREENEDPEIIWRARKEIVHFHFANPHGRVWPLETSEDPEYGKFFKMVKKIRFQGGISIEARGSFEKDAAASLAFFRQELS